MDECSIYSWERNLGEPRLKYVPAIIAFLGYNLLLAAGTMAERLVRHRTSLVFSQEESSKRLGVDGSTLARWERGEREPLGRFLDRVRYFLGERTAEPASGAA